jgi:lysozyme family protein
MPRSIEQMIDNLIRHEGSCVDRAQDRGGPTNFGISHLVEPSRAPVSSAEVRRLDRRTGGTKVPKRPRWRLIA